MLNYFRKKLFEETSIYSLVFMRISFGCLMLWEALRYIFSPYNWIYNYYIKEGFHFKYYGFSWVKPLPGDLMYLHFYALAFLAFLIIIGAFYRIAIILFTLGFLYVFLIDQAHYLNHFYMMILFLTLLCFMPANCYFSVDAWLRPKIKTNVINFWPVFLLRAQIEIILFYAGIVKINYEWMHALPLKFWLPEANVPDFLSYFFHQPWMPIVGSYGTILLHVLGAPLMLWKPTRLYVFILYCCFHITNSFTFQIGIFPWLTIATTLIFFDANWPQQILKFKEKIKDRIFHRTSKLKKDFIIYFVLVWSLVQIFVPMRNMFYPGYMLWTHEGHDFSWRMKIQDISGFSAFIISDKNSDITRTVTYNAYNSMHCQPDMILQFAHFLRDRWKEYGYDVRVNVRSTCSLNRRHEMIFINPLTDLAQEKRGFHHYNWIMPFDKEIR